ncbi:hypothetical protein [Nocardia sp. NPDC004722]
MPQTVSRPQHQFVDLVARLADDAGDLYGPIPLRPVVVRCVTERMNALTGAVDDIEDPVAGVVDQPGEVVEHGGGRAQRFLKGPESLLFRPHRLAHRSQAGTGVHPLVETLSGLGESERVQPVGTGPRRARQRAPRLRPDLRPPVADDTGPVRAAPVRIHAVSACCPGTIDGGGAGDIGRYQRPNHFHRPVVAGHGPRSVGGARVREDRTDTIGSLGQVLIER